MNESRIIESYAEAFDSIGAAPAAGAKGPGAAWLSELRRSGFESFREAGLPHRKHEHWKHNNLGILRRQAFLPAMPNADFAAGLSLSDIEAWLLPELEAHRLVFVDGLFAPALSEIFELPAGVLLGNLASHLTSLSSGQSLRPNSAEFSGTGSGLSSGQPSWSRSAKSSGPGAELFSSQSSGSGSGIVALDERLGVRADAFTRLSDAFFSDGLFLELGEGVKLERPVHLIFLGRGDGILASPRNILRAGADSEAMIVETYASLSGGIQGGKPGGGSGEASGEVSGDVGFCNAVSEIDCGKGANIRHYKLLRENEVSQHVGRCLVRQAARSRYASVEVVLGGAMVRRDLELELLGEHSDCELNALFNPRGDQLHDLRTRVTHAVPKCRTQELYKGIVDERGRGIFDGLIYVARDAQQTDARQSNRNLLLSEDARVNSMPRLEIYADDVKCSHGSTTGQLEDEQIFYLRSRGIETEAAKALLTWGFAREIIDLIENPELRKRLNGELLRRLPRGEMIEATL